MKAEEAMEDEVRMKGYEGGRECLPENHHYFVPGDSLVPAPRAAGRHAHTRLQGPGRRVWLALCPTTLSHPPSCPHAPLTRPVTPPHTTFAPRCPGRARVEGFM